MIKIAIGADHRGFNHKEYIKKHVKYEKNEIDWIDVGAHNDERSDYPIFARDVSQKTQQKEVALGVLLCGSGIGMAVVANRYPGIYAGLVWNEKIARLAREHDNVNILVLPADFLTPEVGAKLVHEWLNTEFKGGRYKDRIDLIDALKECPS